MRHCKEVLMEKLIPNISKIIMKLKLHELLGMEFCEVFLPNSTPTHLKALDAVMLLVQISISIIMT